MRKVSKNTDIKTLTDRYYRKALNIAMKKTGNREDAEDLCQETFLRAMRFFDSYDQREPFENWLYKIMANVSIDMHRRGFAYRNPNMCLFSLDQPLQNGDSSVYCEIPDTEQNPLSIIIENDRKEATLSAINSLKPKFREVIYLADIENMSYEEIADTMKIKVGTVRSRLHRARKDVQAIITE
ncbi:MAG: sigma-70 family RNA polymerase sigma factor [Armatimonadetes bacterium]|nr:sigma-70 family RNA polymerase sigma factor [Candidatus Hippobium faecium]